MNKAILVGNLTKDPEMRTTPSGVSVTSFTVAVQRRYKDADGERQADFISCVAWRGTAEFIAKHFIKGQKIGIVGSLQTRTYDDQNGVRRYVTEVVVDEAEFVTSKAQNSGTNKQSAEDLFGEDLSDLQQIDDEILPF